MAKSAMMYGVAKLLNSSGYIIWLFQIFWLILLYVNSFFASPIGKIIKPEYVPQPQDQNPSSPILANGLPPIPSWALAILAAGLVLFTLYIVFMNYLPAVNKTSERIVEKAAEQVVDKIELTHKKNSHISQKKYLQMTQRMMFWVKITLSCLPILVVLFGRENIEYIPHQAAIGVTSALSLIAVLLFIGHRSFSATTNQTTK